MKAYAPMQDTLFLGVNLTTTLRSFFGIQMAPMALCGLQAASGAEHVFPYLPGAGRSGQWHQEEPNRLVHCKREGFEESLTRRKDSLVSEAARRVTRVEICHPEGYLEAFANLYTDFAKAVFARLRQEPSDQIQLPRERFEELQRVDYARREVLEHEELFWTSMTIFRRNSCASESFLFAGKKRDYVGRMGSSEKPSKMAMRGNYSQVKRYLIQMTARITFPLRENGTTSAADT